MEGPINKKVYASYAPKRHAVAVARREADKRGFKDQSGRLVQIVTDGDNDLECYVKDLFPIAIHTIDIFHVTEYLWKAGGCLYKEGSEELVEGAVNYVIAKRFDSGGMRWIKERAEPLLQLRCIEVNNDWDAFISYVHDKTSRQAQLFNENFFLKSTEAIKLPTYGLNCGSWPVLRMSAN